MRKQKRNNNQKKKKVKNNKKENGDDTQSIIPDVTYTLINEEYNNNFKKNFYIKSIRTDGNCLFRAVADQLYNEEENYKEIRKMVVEHLLKKEDEYKHFIENDESFQSYIERISMDGTWGGQLELQAIGEIFNVNILIYQENGCILEIKIHDDANKCIQLHYASNEHYNSVRFKNKAQDELKTIFDLREILNSKDDNDSSKTFYETTENEMTDDCSSINSMNEQDEKNSFNGKESIFIQDVRTNVEGNLSNDIRHRENNEVTEKINDDIRNGQMLMERRGLSNYMNNKNITSEHTTSEYNIDNNIGILMEDNTQLKPIDIFQMIFNDIKKKNNEIKYTEKNGKEKRKRRSRSMPNINENFLYFFSKNKIIEKIESDSTIDSLNEKKSIKKKQKQKKLKKKKVKFLKCNYFSKHTKEINEQFSKIIVKEKRNMRVCYNKIFYKQLSLLDKTQTEKGFYPLDKGKNDDIRETEETDIGEEEEEVTTIEKRENEKNVEFELGNKGYFSSHDIYTNQNSDFFDSQRKSIIENSKLNSQGNDTHNSILQYIEKKKVELKNEMNYENYLTKPKLNKKNINFFDIIVDDFEMTIDIDSFFSGFSNKFATNLTKKKSSERFNKQKVNFQFSDESSDSSVANLHTQDTFEDNNEMENEEKIKEKEEIITIKNVKDLILKKKYHNEKFVQMFSKEFYSKGLFNFVNADFFLNDNELHYILEFISRYKKVNIFKKGFNKYNYYYSDDLMFYFQLDNEIFEIKKKISKENYEEFLIKAERKYKKILKNNKKWKKKKKEKSRVKIIFI